MMEIRCSIYKGYRQPMPVKTESLSWNRFCDYFVGGEWLEKAKSKGVTYPEKKNLPCYGFYLLKPETSRANENVVQIYAIGMDFDSGDNVEDVEAVFGDWRCAIHTTWSHTDSSPRCRVVLPLSRAVSVREFDILIRWAMEYAESNGLSPDTACKDPSRLWFIPATKNPELYRFVIFYEDDAPCIDVDSILKGDEQVTSETHVDEQNVVVQTFKGPVNITAWYERSQLGDKLKCSCPHHEGSSIGSAFLRRCKTSVMLVCTSQNHGHEKLPWKQRYLPEGYEDPKKTLGEREQKVMDHLIMRMRGGEVTDIPTPCSSNLMYILSLDTRWVGRIWMNDFENNVWLDSDDESRPWADEDDMSISIWCQRVYNVNFSTSIVRETINLHAKKNRRNPLHDWIESTEWDGTCRLSDWIVDGFGAHDTPINRIISRKWAVQAIARAYNPGCQADSTIVLIGAQGAGKSTGLRALAGDYFSDTPLEFNKDSYLQISRAWIYEIAELDSFRGRANSQIKAFLTAPSDIYRPPYGRRSVEVKRHVVFSATTNERSILSDSTGARRFWPVEVGEVDRVWIQENRMQIWAEALVCYRGEHPKFTRQYWLTRTEEDLLVEAQKPYQVEDAWQQLIEQFFEAPEQKNQTYFSITDIMHEGLGLERYQMNVTNQKRVGETLRRIGMEKVRRRDSRGRRQNVWVFKVEDPFEEVEEAWDESSMGE